MDKTIFATTGRLPSVPLKSVDENDPNFAIIMDAVRMAEVQRALNSGARIPTFEVR